MVAKKKTPRAATTTDTRQASIETSIEDFLRMGSPKAYQALGQLVARAKGLARPEVEARYTEGFMTALETIATPRRHANVLQHMAGYFKTTLDEASRAELQAAIEDYRAGLVPLVVPITLFRHHVRHHGVPYLAGQVYLEPHPKELMLRNHV
jgi:uncharacterized protein YbgA (DUF1722 family)